MAELIVDTTKMRSYGDKLISVNNRLNKVEQRISLLYMKAGLLGIWQLIQADSIGSYRWKILLINNYLINTASELEIVDKKLFQADPAHFTPVQSKKSIIYNVGKAVKKTVKKVKNVVSKTIKSAFDSYYSHGKVYKIVQYGKAVLKAAKGVGKIVAGVGSLIGSGGLSTPVSLLSILSGANDVYNALMDGAYTYTGQYEKVGKTNALKDKLVEGGRTIGDLIGNQRIGETFGAVTYYGIDLVTSLASLEVGIAKVKQLTPTNYRLMGTEIKEISKIKVDGIFTTDFEVLRYNAKLAGYMFSETTNFLSNAGTFYGLAENAIKVGKNIDKIITVNMSGSWQNPVLEVIEKITDIKDYVGKGTKVVTKATKMIFG